MSQIPHRKREQNQVPGLATDFAPHSTQHSEQSQKHIIDDDTSTKNIFTHDEMKCFV